VPTICAAILRILGIYTGNQQTVTPMTDARVETFLAVAPEGEDPTLATAKKSSKRRK